MKKIVIVFSELFFGGAEKQFRELAKGLGKKGYKVYIIVSGTQKNLGNKELYEEFISINEDIEFYFLKNLKLSSSIFGKIHQLFRYNQQLNKILNMIKPNAVFFYNGLELTGSYIAKKNGAKVFFSERESGNRGTLKLLRYRFFFIPTEKIICNSLSAQRYYRKNNIDTIYIPNGIEIKPATIKLKEKKFEILVPARFAKVKNQEVVIKALSHLNNPNVVVKFIGKAEDKKYLQDLKKLADDLKIAEQIEFLEFTNNMENMYRNCDLVILPSKMEGFTNVLLESYMYGRICLISDIEMNRDVANKNNQRFFNYDDSEELTDNIVKIINMSDYDIKNETKTNKEYVEKNFSLKRMIDMYDQQLKKIYK